MLCEFTYKIATWDRNWPHAKASGGKPRQTRVDFTTIAIRLRDRDRVSRVV